MVAFQHRDDALRELDIRPLLNQEGEPAGSEVPDAMAYAVVGDGTAAVARFYGALPEAVEAGRNGFVVPAGDDVALVSALDVLARNPGLRVEMGLNGRRIAEERFDSRRNAQQVLDVLKSVCPQRKASAEAQREAVST